MITVTLVKLPKIDVLVLSICTGRDQLPAEVHASRSCKGFQGLTAAVLNQNATGVNMISGDLIGRSALSMGSPRVVTDLTLDAPENLAYKQAVIQAHEACLKGAPCEYGVSWVQTKSLACILCGALYSKSCCSRCKKVRKVTFKIF